MNVLRRLVDDAHGDSIARQLDCHDQSDWTGPWDENIFLHMLTKLVVACFHRRWMTHGRSFVRQFAAVCLGVFGDRGHVRRFSLLKKVVTSRRSARRTRGMPMSRTSQRLTRVPAPPGSNE
jgi:hypothetical protein